MLNMARMSRVVHTITPGDHFSPRTGSAIPTVVHGLAAAAEQAGDRRQAVVLDDSTYRPRYASADVLEYRGVRRPSTAEQRRDVLRGRLGMQRQATATYFQPLVALLREESPSSVIAHNAPLLPLLLSQTPHDVVLYMHNQLFRTYSQREAGRALATVKAIVCVSESLADDTRRLLPARLADRVHVVQNAVDTEQFCPADAVRRRGPLRVLFVGRVIPPKGADVLLRAAAEFAAGEIEVRVVGSQGFDPHASLSPHELELRAIAAQAAVEVEFLPFVPRAEVAALYRDADVLVVPSRWAEPSGLTIGEGLASGLPVIASEVGGIPEVLGDAGVLVPPADPHALAGALRGLLNSPEERIRLSKSGRSRAEVRDWAWAWRNLREVISAR